MTPRPQALKNSKTRNPPSESESKSWGLVTYRCDFVLDVIDGHCQIYSSLGTSRLPLHQYTVFLWFCEVLNRKESIPCVWLVLWGEILLDDLDGHVTCLSALGGTFPQGNNGDNMGQRVNDAKASSRSTVTFGCSFSGAGGTWNTARTPGG